MTAELLGCALSIGLGLVFVLSAVPKLRRPKSFVLVVLGYRILPQWLGVLYARLLPGAELLVACLLLTGLLPAAASMAAALFLVTFIAGIVINLARGRHIECGCFGNQRHIGWSLVLQDAGLLCAAVLIFAISRPQGIVASWSAVHILAASSYLPVLSLVACLAAVVWTLSPVVSGRHAAGEDAKPETANHLTHWKFGA